MLARVLCMFCCVATTRVYAAPTVPAGNGTDITANATLLYTADHDVTRLGVLFDEHTQFDSKKPLLGKTIFYIESDTNERGERIDYGLYVLKDGIKSKLLDNARDIAVLNLTLPYFAANDGIYLYNKTANLAQKYGSVNDDVISIATENGTGVFYYLNKQNQLYKVTEDGQKATIVDQVKNAEEIVVDYTGHLYYYTSDKTFYVYDGENVRKVEGLPENIKKVWFLKTPVLVQDVGLVSVDNQPFVIAPNGTSYRQARSGQGVVISAASADTGFVLYFANNRKIYELNILEKIFEGLIQGLDRFLKEMAQSIRDSINSAFESP